MRFVILDVTLEDDRTVLYKTKSLDGTEPNTNPNTNHIQLFYAFFEHRPMIFELAQCFYGYLYFAELRNA